MKKVQERGKGLNDNFVKASFADWCENNELEELDLSSNNILTSFAKTFLPILEKKTLKFLILIDNPVVSLGSDELKTFDESESVHLAKLVWLPALVLDNPTIFKDLYSKFSDFEAIVATHREYYSRDGDYVRNLGNRCDIKHPEFMNMVNQAAQGSAKACNLLGSIFYHRQDYENAVDWYDLAVNRGDLDAFERLQECRTFIQNTKQQVTKPQDSFDNKC